MPQESINCDLLVVGGGIAGITAAVEAAEVGKSVVLVEREHYLGGRVIQMHRYFPKMCPPVCGLEINFRRIRQNRLITVLTGTTPKSVENSSGGVRVSLDVAPRYVNDKCTACGDCEKVCTVDVDDRFNLGISKARAIRLPHELAFPYRYFVEAEAANDLAMKKVIDSCKVGAIELDMQSRPVEVNARSVIWATGWEPYDARKLDALGFGALPNVVTNMMFERMASESGPYRGKISRPSDGAPIGRAAFIQCAGSRDVNHLPYCSAVCCMASLKQSRYLRDQYPEAEIHIFFIDARTPGRREDFYQEVQKDSKCVIHRGKVGRIEPRKNGAVVVTAENTLTGALEAVEVDLAILAVGMAPTAKLQPPPVALARDEFGFLSMNVSQPIIAAGVAAGPKDVAATVEEATGAVAQMLKYMAGGT